jgi:hypothetical protein
MSHRVTQWRGFDPEFDDTEWTDGWLHVPIAQAPPGEHASGYWVERRILQYTEIFGKPYRLSAPLTCRLLFDPDGRLWMSDTPQERIMMYNNGRRTWGQVLVGGLGLGLYPQFAAVGAVGRATHFTVIERSQVVRDIVEPTLSVALETPLEVRTGDIVAYLSGSVSTRFDTIFLDTWDTLDAVHLPAINRMRDLALRHLVPGGQVLLWGYRWMVRLFEEACRQLMDVAPGQRATWLMARAEKSPRAVALMTPVVKHLKAREGEDVEEALAWCRQYVEQRVEPI